MKLSEFFQNIALGELASSPYVQLNGFALDKEQLPRVIHSLNQALEYFYSNFPLKISQVIIERKVGISRYYLDADYAYSNPEQHIKYIVDTLENPFQNDVLHILSVKNTDGYEYPLNDSMAFNKIMTPEYNCISVDDYVKASHLVITYMAGHPKIPLTEPIDSNYRIQIPSSYRTALQTYVACLLFHNLGGDKVGVSNALFGKFRTLTEELKAQGIGTVTQTGSNIKPLLRGWI